MRKIREDCGLVLSCFRSDSAAGSVLWTRDPAEEGTGCPDTILVRVGLFLRPPGFRQLGICTASLLKLHVQGRAWTMFQKSTLASPWGSRPQTVLTPNLLTQHSGRVSSPKVIPSLLLRSSLGDSPRHCVLRPNSHGSAFRFHFPGGIA